MLKLVGQTAAHNKIEAIKILRAITGWGLADSKHWVEQVQIVFNPWCDVQCWS